MQTLKKSLKRPRRRKMRAMSDSVAEHYMEKLEHQKAITESCTQTIEFLQKKVENQRRELKRRTHAIGDLVRIREENQRLKEEQCVNRNIPNCSGYTYCKESELKGMNDDND